MLKKKKEEREKCQREKQEAAAAKKKQPTRRKVSRPNVKALGVDSPSTPVTSVPNTPSTSATVIPDASSTLVPDTQSTATSADEDTVRNKRRVETEPFYDECAFCFGVYCNDGQEWIQCACGKWGAQRLCRSVH